MTVSLSVGDAVPNPKLPVISLRKILLPVIFHSAIELFTIFFMLPLVSKVTLRYSLSIVPHSLLSPPMFGNRAE